MVFARGETNDLATERMGLHKDHQLVCDYDVRLVFHGASIRYGSTKSLVLHRDDHWVDQKIGDGVDEEQPIQ